MFHVRYYLVAIIMFNTYWIHNPACRCYEFIYIPICIMYSSNLFYQYLRSLVLLYWAQSRRLDNFFSFIAGSQEPSFDLLFFFFAKLNKVIISALIGRIIKLLNNESYLALTNSFICLKFDSYFTQSAEPNLLIVKSF